MKKSINKSDKITYVQPSIECIKLDNDISLQLQSIPPLGPDETYNWDNPQIINNTPFKNSTC
jgi:hypothetical protein